LKFKNFFFVKLDYTYIQGCLDDMADDAVVLTLALEEVGKEFGMLI